MLEIMRENASGWIVKILFAIIIIVFVFAFGMSGLDTGNDPVLATVNDQVITRAEFEEAFQRAAESMRRANPQVTSAQLQSPQFKQLIFNQLVNSRLLLTEATRLGIAASDEEVFAAITRQSVFWNQEGQFDRNIYQMALRSIHMTPAQFEANFRNEFIADKVKNMVRKAGEATSDQARSIFDWVNETVTIDYIQSSPAEFMDSVEVTDGQVQEYYTKNEKTFMVPEQVRIRYIRFTPEDLASYQKVTDEEIKKYYDAHSDSMMQKEEVKARHILVRANASDDENAQKKAKDKIDRILKKAKAGEDFAELAKAHSEGPSKTSGGDLGWFGRGAMVPEFEEVAFSIPKGGISEPVKTQFGWHIIKVEDKKEAQAKPLEETKEEITTILAEEKAAEKVSDLLDQGMDRLVSGMNLEEVADELGLLAVTSQPLPERLLPQSFGMTPEASKVVMQIPQGESHPTPLAINNGYMLLEKVEDIPATPMDLSEVKDMIVQKIKQEKASEMAQKAADEILATVTSNPEAVALYKEKMTTSQPFSRQGIVPNLGQNRNLATAVFASRGHGWLPQAFSMADGVIVVRPNKRIPASDELWEKQKNAWIQQASQHYEDEVLVAFMEGLRQKATIEIARPDLLN